MGTKRPCPVLVTHITPLDLIRLIFIFGSLVDTWPFDEPGFASVDGAIFKIPAWLDFLIVESYE
jgi:hypothetical protein